MQDAISAAIAAAPCELWCFHSSRLARGSGMAQEARSLMELLVYLRRSDVVVRAVEDDAFVTNRMLWGVAEELSHKYSLDLSAHTRKGKRAAFAAGRWAGGPTPDGYRLSPPGADGRRELALDPERAKIIRRMFELRAEGLSFNRIARTISERHRTRTGLPFTPKRVQDTLSNPVYAARTVLGRDTPEERTATGTWEPLIAPELFDKVAVQAHLRRRQKGRGRPPTAFALTGLATCERCGGRMVGWQAPYVRKDGSRQRVYRCTGIVSGTCGAPRIDAERVDRAVADELASLFIDFKAWERELAAAGTQQQKAIGRELAMHKKIVTTKAKASGTLKAKLERALAEGTEDTALEALYRELISEREEALGRMGELQAALDAEPTANALRDAHDALARVLRDESAPINERLRRLFAQFRLARVGDEIMILPVLLPDVVERHGRTPSGDIEGTTTPVILMVPPPTPELLLQKEPHAWA